jgi:hypothetical protein
MGWICFLAIALGLSFFHLTTISVSILYKTSSLYYTYLYTYTVLLQILLYFVCPCACVCRVDSLTSVVNKRARFLLHQDKSQYKDISGEKKGEELNK